MRKTLLLAVLLSISPIARGVAAPPTPAKVPAAPPPAYDRLIEQLGDSEYRKRAEATRLLEVEGIKAIPALKKALGHPDSEVRRRALDLIPRLETAALVAPRRVTLKLTATLPALFNEMSKQTGYCIDYGTNRGGGARTYSFDFKDVPFWQAVDRICRDANLVLQPNYGGGDRVVLQHQGGHVAHVHHDGAFRFVPTGFQLFRNMEFGLVGGAGTPPNRNETLTLNFQVFSEPRNPMLGIGQVRLTAAYDSEKNSMMAPANNGLNETMMMGFGGGFIQQGFVSHYGNGNRSYMQQSQFTLNRPSQKANKLKLVRGDLPVTLLVEQKPVVVTDNILKAKGKRSTIGTTTFHIQDVTVQPNKQIQLKLDIREDNKENPNDWTWMNTLFQRIELQDDKGNKYQVFGTNWGNSAPGNVQMTLTYGVQPNAKKVGPPSKFVFQYWRTMQHQVHFEFKDLPLP